MGFPIFVYVTKQRMHIVYLSFYLTVMQKKKYVKRSRVKMGSHLQQV